MLCFTIHEQTGRFSSSLFVTISTDKTSTLTWIPHISYKKNLEINQTTIYWLHHLLWNAARNCNCSTALPVCAQSWLWTLRDQQNRIHAPSQCAHCTNNTVTSFTNTKRQNCNTDCTRSTVQFFRGVSAEPVRTQSTCASVHS